MRIIQDNYSKFPRMAICTHCGSQIELESEQDLSNEGNILDANEYFWRCPCCDYLNLIRIEL